MFQGILELFQGEDSARTENSRKGCPFLPSHVIDKSH
jgi:hypothetical protein